MLTAVDWNVELISVGCHSHLLLVLMPYEGSSLFVFHRTSFIIISVDSRTCISQFMPSTVLSPCENLSNDKHRFKHSAASVSPYCNQDARVYVLVDPLWFFWLVFFWPESLVARSRYWCETLLGCLRAEAKNPFGILKLFFRYRTDFMYVIWTLKDRGSFFKGRARPEVTGTYFGIDSFEKWLVRSSSVEWVQ
jgi:hypothetical protein